MGRTTETKGAAGGGGGSAGEDGRECAERGLQLATAGSLPRHLPAPVALPEHCARTAPSSSSSTNVYPPRLRPPVHCLTAPLDAHKRCLSTPSTPEPLLRRSPSSVPRTSPRSSDTSLRSFADSNGFFSTQQHHQPGLLSQFVLPCIRHTRWHPLICTAVAMTRPVHTPIELSLERQTDICPARVSCEPPGAVSMHEPTATFRVFSPVLTQDVSVPITASGSC